jgi:hypothetical protein
VIIEHNIRQKILDAGFSEAEADTDGGVFSALISAPYAHPVWRDYWLMVVHLRPVVREGNDLPTIMYLPDATHEMWLYALDPDFTLEQHDKMARPRVLLPMNFAAQLVRPSDEAVIEEMRELAKEIEDGRMNPDTDNARAWRQRFGDNMVKEEWR